MYQGDELSRRWLIIKRLVQMGLTAGARSNVREEIGGQETTKNFRVRKEARERRLGRCSVGEAEAGRCYKLEVRHLLSTHVTLSSSHSPIQLGVAVHTYTPQHSPNLLFR